MNQQKENLRTVLFKLMSLISAASLITACNRSPSEVSTQIVVEVLPSPAPVGSLVPQVSAMHDGSTILSWFEPRPDSGYTFRMAVYRKDEWSAPQTIVSDTRMTMFSAVLPSVASFQDGTLLSHWDIHVPGDADPYSNLIHVARSRDGGQSWSTPLVPHRDNVSGQHSFVSTFPASDSLGLVWLDARRQRYIPPPPGASADEAQWHGNIGLQYTTIASNGGLGAEATIDSMTCECCPTAAAMTSRGPVVVYRDRQPAEREVHFGLSEIRDIHLIRLEGGRWRSPVRVNADNWLVTACPDNGPAVDAEGERVAVAWWTAAGDSPMVKIAFSENAGNSFGAALRLDQGNGDGQVTVALLGEGAIVGWLEQGETWARWVAPDGRMSAMVSLGPSPHRSRLPRWLASDGSLFAVWTSKTANDATQVRVSQLRLITSAR